MHRFSAFALLVFVLAACDGSGVSADYIEVRVANETGFTIDSARIEIKAFTAAGVVPGSEREVTVGSLQDGDRSTYAVLDDASDYTYASARVYGIPGVNQPFSPLRATDDITASLGLAPGRYTYRLKLEPYTASLLRVQAADASQPDAPASDIEVRVENQSDVAFGATSVSFINADRDVIDRVDYGALAPGEASSYQSVSFAYPYTPAEVVVGSDTLRYRVTDFVGATPLDPGRYTLGLRVESQTAYRDQTELVRDGDL